MPPSIKGVKKRWRERSTNIGFDVQVLPPESDSSISLLQASERPDVHYQDIGGLDMQKQEIREAVELPLTHPDLYQQIGIDPPRGVLLYGPPGTGKTMMVKAVANNTKASFIRVVGSEFVQKYLGEVRANQTFIFVRSNKIWSSNRFDRQNLILLRLLVLTKRINF